MASPIKHMIPEFKRMENQIMKVICELFGIEWPLDPCVKIADNIMLATEARDLMVSPPKDWHLQTQTWKRVLKFSRNLQITNSSFFTEMFNTKN